MKKYLIAGVASLFLVLGLGAMAVLAETPTTTSATVNASPMMISIGPNGNAMLRGTVVSIDTTSLVVKSWGGSWTIRTSATTKIMSPNKVLNDFKADDTVGILGEISQDGTFIIDARILRQWGKKIDSDHDGIPNNQDNDDDNDGIRNNQDSRRGDHDDDGIVDSLDTDDDNDGILDTEDTKPHDSDNDGISDGRDRHEGRGDKLEKMMKDFKMRGENRGSGSLNSGSNDDNDDN